MQPLPEAPFDKELGLVFTEISPDRTRAQLDVVPKLLQPMGIVHGGVYCSMVESLASVAAYTWIATNGGGPRSGAAENPRSQELTGGLGRLVLMGLGRQYGQLFEAGTGEGLLLSDRELSAPATQKRHNPRQHRGDLVLEH